MDNGPWTDLGTFGWFLCVWVVMMAAMMFPSVAPTVALYSTDDAATVAGLSPCCSPPATSSPGLLPGSLAFAIGVSLEPMLGGRVRVGSRRPVGRRRHARRCRRVRAHPLKNVCLGKCRSPLGLLLGSWRDGWSGALRMGAKNGAWCVGCCWALMASLFAWES